MSSDPKLIVAEGYDQIADIYLKRFGESSVREKWLDVLIGSLANRAAHVLDLGCGAGVPVARNLASRGHSVVGVDASAEQLSRARRNVPEATFIQADMCNVSFDVGSFDAICAFYSISHVPSVEQSPLIGRIASWLKPGGTLVASFGTGSSGDWSGSWLGTSMFFGNCDEEATRQQLANAGMIVKKSSIDQQDNEDAAFWWIQAVNATR